MATVQIYHLVGLAETPLGKIQLGELVRRLVWATLAKRQPNVDFLAGETNNLSGWDGSVQAVIDVGGSNEWHRSVWELSTERDVEGKMRADYQSALVKPVPFSCDRSQVVYVAATLRTLTRQKKLVIARQLAKDFGNPWGWITVLAADDFVQWIEKAPAVEDWAATEFKLGNTRFGRSLEHAWHEWADKTSPALDQRLVRVGRELAPLQAALKFDAEKTVSLQGDSIDEALALVYCAIKSLAEQDADLLLANSLVVRDQDAAAKFLTQPVAANSMPLTLLTGQATTLSRRFVQAGHRVIHVFARSGNEQSVLSYERAGTHEFASALTESMGVPEPEADVQARACGCSPSVWHIRNLHNQSLRPALPDWADPTQGEVVVPAVFLGAWCETSRPDSDVIRQLTGLAANTFTDRLRSFVDGENPLLECIGDDRLIVAPTAAFEFVIRNISRAQIDKLAEVCKAVFGTISPQVEEHWAGGQAEMVMRNRIDELSDSLMDGLAETLLRIAVLGQPIADRGVFAGQGSPQAFVNDLIRSLPGLRDNVCIMASLNRQLPVLMEAAPDSFLSALDSLVQGDPNETATWLKDESGVFGRSFHTGVLWGLELLAWSQDYLLRVSMILAKLAELDPGGQLSNRPLNSLREIFLAWHPGTACSPAHRAEVLREIVSVSPTKGWELLLQLMPGKSSVSHPTSRPKWRSLGQTHSPVVFRSEVIAAYQLYVDLTLEFASNDLNRLADLVAHYPNLSSEHRTRLEQALVTARDPQNNQISVNRLWTALHDLISHHRSYADAQWALPTNSLACLEGIAGRFISEDVVTRYQWLFDEQSPETGHPSADFEGKQRELERLRREAIVDILAVKSWQGVHRLIQIAKASYLVGFHIVQADTDSSELLLAMDSWRTGGSRAELMAVQSVSIAMFNRDGNSWTDNFLSFAAQYEWPALAVATAFLDYPDSTSTYELIARLTDDIRTEYWRNRYAYIRLEQGEIDSLWLAAQAFMENGRTIDLIDLNWQSLRRLGYVRVLRILDSLLFELGQPNQSQHLRSLSYDLQRLFDWMRAQPEATISEIAKYEYALLPFLLTGRGETTILSIHKIFSEDPCLFVDVLCDLYKPASSGRPSNNQSLEVQKSRAHAAFELLESWRAPPGVSESDVNEEVLNAWIDRVRQLLRERDRLEIGDQQIGKVLYHLPNDPSDGAWPHIALRRLLQRLKNQDIEKGINIENFNSRGVTSRALFEGGAQERALESRWRSYANTLGSSWPRAAKLCASIADDWNRHAEWEDQSAKRDRAEHSR